MDYNGIELYDQDCMALRTLEHLIGKQIPGQADDTGEQKTDIAYFWNSTTKRVTQLDLSESNLAFIPTIIGDLLELTILNLSWNGIHFLPDSMGKLVKLRSLYLDMNRLARLPAFFANLKDLESLTLGMNKISELGPIVHCK